jgi:hypothetical protein
MARRQSHQSRRQHVPEKPAVEKRRLLADERLRKHTFQDSLHVAEQCPDSRGFRDKLFSGSASLVEQQHLQASVCPAKDPSQLDPCDSLESA